MSYVCPCNVNMSEAVLGESCGHHWFQWSKVSFRSHVTVLNHFVNLLTQLQPPNSSNGSQAASLNAKVSLM